MPHDIISPFEAALRSKIAEIRRLLQEIETLPAFRLDIEIDGRVHDGDINVIFKLSEGHYSSATEGGDIDATVREFARRFGWKARNAPLRLSHLPELPEAIEPPVAVEDEDGIQF